MKVDVEWTPPMRFEGLAENQTTAVMEGYGDGCSVAAMLRRSAELTYEIAIEPI